MSLIGQLEFFSVINWIFYDNELCFSRIFVLFEVFILTKENLCSVRFYFQANNQLEFGDSWMVEGSQCESVEPDPCDPESETYKLAEDLCYGLISETGPFTECHEVVDPTPYYEACIYDLCATLPDDDLVCDSLAEYAQACREGGGMPDDWRAVTPQCREY